MSLDLRGGVKDVFLSLSLTTFRRGGGRAWPTPHLPPYLRWGMPPHFPILSHPCRECSLSRVLLLLLQVVLLSVFQQRILVVDSSLLKLLTCVLAQPETLHLPLHLSCGSASSLYEGSYSHLAQVVFTPCYSGHTLLRYCSLLTPTLPQVWWSLVIDYLSLAIAIIYIPIYI